MIIRCIAAVIVLTASTVSAQTPPRCEAERGRKAERLTGEVSRGKPLGLTTAGGWILRLVPVAEGWLLEVTTRDRSSEDLARLTPPWHFTPNPRQIYGWHFRNLENTGPNEGSVNAPQELREFIFSPGVGREIQGPGANASPTEEDVRQVAAFGRGWLFVESYQLTPPRRGERAAFETLRFSACLTSPAD